MSPSRRRATGAVRGLASPAHSPVRTARAAPPRRTPSFWRGNAAPSAAWPPGSRRRAIIARGGSPPRCAAWQVAHAESFACRGSVRGTVRGRAAHPARCHNRAAITHAIFARALPGGAMGTSRPTAITHAKFARHYARNIRTRITWAARWQPTIARGGSPPRCAAWHPTFPRRGSPLARASSPPASNAHDEPCPAQPLYSNPSI